MASKFQNRLVGTIVLVALGVIILPWLLDGQKNIIRMSLPRSRWCQSRGIAMSRICYLQRLRRCLRSLRKGRRKRCEQAMPLRHRWIRREYR